MRPTATWLERIRTRIDIEKYAVVLLLFLMVLPSYGATARRGWTKVELASLDGSSVAPALVTLVGGTLIGDYGSYAIASVPAAALDALKTAAATERVRVRVRDELDQLQLPGGVVDVREGIGAIAASKLSNGYPAGKAGVFVLQFTASPRKEWLAALQALGWTLSRYIPNDGYLVIGPPELAAQTRALAYVQWLDLFHPYQKAVSLRGDGASHDLLFELPSGAASEAAVEAIRVAAERASFDVHRGSLDTLVYARMSDAAATALLQNPMILSVGPAPDGQLADGRQAQSLSPLLNAAQTQPTPGADYWSWVLAHCPDCASMPSGAWKIGVADSGLDNGASQFGHPDLAGRKLFGILGYNPAFNPDPQCAPGQPACDQYRHGTLVSGIAAGNASSGARDSGGFLMGLGGAPTAGIFMTKIFTAITGIDPSRLFLWTADAANNGATIQNHSWESTLDAGHYDALSRQFDVAARDADDAASAARPQILLTVAAGNDDNGTGMKTSPVGMAKNVLTVGGLENYRPEADAFSCRQTRGDSFMNIMRTSRTGTALPGYIKPDVMAPASVIVSTQTSIWWPDPPNAGYCLKSYEGDVRYSGDSGTSFAAPLGAAASIVVKRYLGNAPGDTSPALIKATLIAGAHSVRGGEDRSHNPATTVGPVPSQQQGFGRLTLEDILNGAQKPVVFDQSPSRLFTQAGQTFCTRLRIRDAAKPVKVALVWTDTPATAGVTNPLVNDLNLEVRRIASPASVYVGNSLGVTANGEESIAWPVGGALPVDGVNNVEYFRLFMDANEQFNITVRAQNIAGDTDGNLATFEQDYALVILNADLIGVGSCDAPPTALFTLTCSGFTCTADASASSDDFGISGYGWNWGDGQTSTGGPITTHTYASTGVFNVVLTTTDTAGQSTTSTAHAASICTAAPAISAQPTSRTISAGQSTTLTVAASQVATYQWFRGTTGSTANPVGGNSSSLTVSPTATTSYWVRVANGCGSVDSATAVVTVCVPPSITTQPASTSVNPGQSAVLSVTATGSAPLAYQWYEGTSGVTTSPVGTNGSSYATPPLTVSKSYWVRVTSSCNGTMSVDSNTATVTVVPPQITRRQAANALANSQTGITANWAQPTQAGSLLVAVISGNTDPRFNWTAPGGWVHALTYEWNHIKTSIYYIANAAGGRTSEHFTVDAGFHDQTLDLLEYSGVALTNPLDKTAFDGNNTNAGSVSSGFTATTGQAKELAVTALTTYTPTAFSNPSNGFTEVSDHFIGNNLTTAVHERITTSAGSLGHTATTGGGVEWLGLVVTFRSANPN